MKRNVAKQYADGLFRLALELDAIETILTDLSSFVSILNDEPDMKHFIGQPRIPTGKKKQTVDNLYQVMLKHVQPEQKTNRHIGLDFIKLLLDKGRENLLFDILAEFERDVRDHRGVVLAHVTTAVDLERDLEQKLVARLEKLTSKKIELNKITNPAILGGVILRIQDLQIDGSVRHGLNQVREHICV